MADTDSVSLQSSSQEQPQSGRPIAPRLPRDVALVWRDELPREVIDFGKRRAGVREGQR
jgi:hypothetical protein